MARTDTDAPRYRRCPWCGGQMYLHRTAYLCADPIRCAGVVRITPKPRKG
jgi:hypothetical protein